MKSNLFGKLSAGVAGVALMAIGVVSTPVQAATIGIKFFDRNTFAQGRNPLAFDGSLSWDSEKIGIESISALNFSQQGSLSGGLSNVTGVSYSGDTLKVNLGIGTNQLQLNFDRLSQNGYASPYTTNSNAPYIDTLPGGSLYINNQMSQLRYYNPNPNPNTVPVQARTIQVQFQTSHNVDGKSLSFDGVFNLMSDGRITGWHLKPSNPSYGTRNTSPSSPSSIGTQLPVDVYVDVVKSLSPTGTELAFVESNALRFIFENFPFGLSQAGQVYSDKGFVIRKDGNSNKWDDFTYYAYVPVPEPSTYFGTILAFGAFGAVKVLKHKQKNKETFTP